MELVSVLGLCFTATVLAVVLKQYKSEYAVAVVTVAGIAIFLRILSSALAPVFEFRDAVLDSGVKASYFTVAFKALGICLVTGFITDVCNDFGQTALGNFASSAGKCAIFIMSVPILTELLCAALQFIG